jgi:hypothetical protein
VDRNTVPPPARTSATWGRADRPDAVKGGWYHDVHPEADIGTPARVVVCDATCKRFQAGTMGKVPLRFGCKTRLIE